MVPWTAKAQTPTIETIGNGTYETTLVFPGRFNYNYTASLYKPDMADALNSDFNLSSIAYDVVSSGATIDELTIWVKDVDASEYSNTSYISKYNSFSFYIEGATQVYATTTPFNLAEGWNTFNFTTNFSHRAGKALLVAVRGVSNTLSSSPSYRYTYNSKTVWYKRLNSDPGYNYTFGDTDFTFSGDLANIQLGVTYATGIPSDLTVTYPEGIDTEVTLGWTENGEATAWQICLNDDETNLIEANSNPFSLTGLTPETTYTAKVRANHGDTQSDWSTAVSFTPTLKTVLGTATGAIDFLPCNPGYNYSLTQQIYKVAELGNAADLISIDFYNDGNGEATRDLQIYMTHTDQNAFASLYYDWINVASTDLVFSGPVHFVSKGWTSIVLDTPFAYDGQHNVVITVDDNTGSTAGQSIVNFLCYSLPGAGLQSKYFNDDYNHNYDPTNNPGSSTYALNHKNHIRVMKVQPPTGLTVSDVTTNAATLSWTENGTATSWQICLNGNMNDLITVTENPYTLTNLTPNAYTAKVRAICTEGHTSWTNEVSFVPGDWVTIGSGTETNNFLPFRSYRNYSVTQQIYTTEELGVPGFIQSIDFFKTGTLECSRNIDIYMIHTDLDDYAFQTDNWIPVNSDNLVFSGTVTFGDNCWTTITLDTPFAYDGLHNVAIVIDDNTGSYTPGEVPFLSFTTATAQGFYTFSFTDNFPPTSMPESSWGIVNQKNQIRVMKLVPAALPYSTGFETTCDWTLVNGSCTNAWAWGTAAHAEGFRGLYISNDGGTSNAYTNTSSAMVYAYKTFYLEEGMRCFSYLWRANGQSNYDYLRVALVPASVSLEASDSKPSGFGYNTLPEGWIALDYGSKLNLSSDWSDVFTCVEVPATGYYNMVFAWYNNGYAGAYPPAAIDDVSIEANTCMTPANLTVGNIGATNAVINWTGRLEVDSYTVKYRMLPHIINPVFSEGFENGIGDWTLRNCATMTGIMHWLVHSGSAAFRFGINRFPPQYLISPELSGITEGMWLEFYYLNYSAPCPVTFQMGFSSTDNATASFTFGDEITVSDAKWHRYHEPIPAGTKYICWKYTSELQNDFPDLIIDDIMIGPEDNADGWQTATVAGNANEVNAILTGLSPETIYEAYVYSDCDPDRVTETVRFTTLEPTTLTQSISLSEGENWVSFYVETTLNDLKTALVSASNNASGIKITSQNNGYAIWNGSSWRGSLNSIDVIQMYVVEVPSACEISLDAMLIDPSEHPITIVNGSNWIGFPFIGNMTLINAFDGFAVNGDKVSSQNNGNATYQGSWNGGLSTLQPGQGYKFESTTTVPRTFTYPSGAKKAKPFNPMGK